MSKSTEITAANFDETFPLDYAVSLCAGLSNIDTDSAVVTRLVEWCQDRGYYVSREVCCEVLESQAAGLLQTGDATTTQQISISMDQAWTGSGRLVNGKIVDCGAQFCDDTDESEAVYELIEDAITEGKDEIKIEIEGRDHIVSWSLT